MPLLQSQGLQLIDLGGHLLGLEVGNERCELLNTEAPGEVEDGTDLLHEPLGCLSFAL